MVLLPAMRTLTRIALLAGCAFALGCGPPPTHLVLITIDTLRADHLGGYGYARDTSPALDALAREGIVFTRCYAQSVVTRASHASLFTASYPSTHGVLSNFELYLDRPSLFTALRARGYATAGFVSSAVLNHNFGVQQQLDHFDDALTTTERNRPSMSERPARDTLAAALAYIEDQPRRKPFFVWIHLIDPHGPYAAPAEPDRFVGDAHAKPGRALPLGETNVGFGDIPKYQILDRATDPDYYVARYDAEIRYADDALAAFFARLRELGLYDHTLFVVTADHGETLDEPTHHRYFAHEFLTYEEDARIPLIVREPVGVRRVAALDPDALVLSIDVAPTLLDLLGGEIPKEFEGRSLLRAAHAPDDPVFSLGSYGSPDEKTIGTQRAVVRGPWRYLINTKDGAEELYDRRSDPHETQNVAAQHPDELADLRRALVDFMAKPGRRNRLSDLSPEDRERLRALGYVR
jgi:arylsulfatase A-like enzyme